MKDIFFCPSCGTEQQTKIIEKKQTLSVKGKNITCDVQVRVCAICGEEIIDRELDNKFLFLFYAEYRKTNNLLQPSEIKEIREKYELSQSSFAKLLGFGEKTITRYENGSIQDDAHDNLMRLMSSNDSFKEVWALRKDRLSSKENKRIESFLKTNKEMSEISFTFDYTSYPKYCTKPHNSYGYKIGGYKHVEC